MIMLYVQPSELLKKKFNDLWTKVSDIEIKRAKDRYAERIMQIKLLF